MREPVTTNSSSGSSPADRTDRARRTFPRERRIRKRREFVRIQSEGARVNTRHFLLLLSKRAQQAEGDSDALSRLGVVASRKIGCAVLRNRAKRLVREAFRGSPGLVPDAFDVVIIVRPGAHQLALKQVLAELQSVAPQIVRTCNRHTRTPLR